MDLADTPESVDRRASSAISSHLLQMSPGLRPLSRRSSVLTDLAARRGSVLSQSSGDLSAATSKNKVLKAEIDNLTAELRLSQERNERTNTFLEAQLGKAQKEIEMLRADLQKEVAENQQLRTKHDAEIEQSSAMRRRVELQSQSHTDQMDLTHRTHQQALSDLQAKADSTMQQLTHTSSLLDTCKAERAQLRIQLEEQKEKYLKEIETLKSDHRQKLDELLEQKSMQTEAHQKQEQDITDLQRTYSIAVDELTTANSAIDKQLTAFAGFSANMHQTHQELTEQLTTLQASYKAVDDHVAQLQLQLTTENEELSQKLRECISTGKEAHVRSMLVDF